MRTLRAWRSVRITLFLFCFVRQTFGSSNPDVRSGPAFLVEDVVGVGEFVERLNRNV
jgi:hypothetical protein